MKARTSPTHTFLHEEVTAVVAKEKSGGFDSLTRSERVLFCVWKAEAAMVHGDVDSISERAVREGLAPAFVEIGAPRKAAVIGRLIAHETTGAAARHEFGKADEDVDRLLLRYWVRHVPGAQAELCRRTCDLRRYFSWVAAWMLSLLVVAFIVDWSFAGSAVQFFVPFVTLGWLALGVTVIVQAVRTGRWASIQRRLLVALAIPFAFIAQSLLLSAAIGPPSDVSLTIEFKEHRADFERLLSMLQEDKTVVRLFRDPAETDGVDPVRDFVPVDRLASYRRLLSSLRLSSIERGSTQGWVEFTRWRGRAPWRVSEGFLSSDVPPADLVESVGDAPKARAQVFRPIEGKWYLFRRVW